MPPKTGAKGKEKATEPEKVLNEGRIAAARDFGHAGAEKITVDGGSSDFAISRTQVIDFVYAFASKGNPNEFYRMALIDQLAFSRAFSVLPGVDAKILALSSYYHSFEVNWNAKVRESTTPELKQALKSRIIESKRRTVRVLGDFLGELYYAVGSAWKNPVFDSSLLPATIEFKRGPGAIGDYLNPDNPSPMTTLVILNILGSIASSFTGGVMASLVITEINVAGLTEFFRGLISKEGFITGKFAPGDLRTPFSRRSRDLHMTDIEERNYRRLERAAFALQMPDASLDHDGPLMISFDVTPIEAAIYNRRVEQATEEWLHSPSPPKLPLHPSDNSWALTMSIVDEYQQYERAKDALIDAIDKKIAQRGSIITSATKERIIRALNDLSANFVGMYRARAAMLSILTSQIKAGQREPYANHFLVVGEPGTGKTETSMLFGAMLVDLGLVTPPAVDKMLQLFGGALGRMGENTIEEYRRKYNNFFAGDDERRQVFSEFFEGTQEDVMVALFNKTQPYYGKVTKTTPDELVGAFQGQTEVRVEDMIMRTVGGAMIVDEAQTIGAKPQDGVTILNAFNATITELGTAWASFLLGYEEEIKRMFTAINPGLNSRYTQTIRMTNYNPRELTAIMIRKVTSDNRGLLNLVTASEVVPGSGASRLEDIEGMPAVSAPVRGRGRAKRQALSSGDPMIVGDGAGKATHADHFEALTLLSPADIKLRTYLTLEALLDYMMSFSRRVIVERGESIDDLKLSGEDVEGLRGNIFGTGNARAVTGFLLWANAPRQGVVPVTLQASPQTSFTLYSAGSLREALRSPDIIGRTFSTFQSRNGDDETIAVGRPLQRQFVYELSDSVEALRKISDKLTPTTSVELRLPLEYVNLGIGERMPALLGRQIVAANPSDDDTQKLTDPSEFSPAFLKYLNAAASMKPIFSAEKNNTALQVNYELFLFVPSQYQ